MSDQQDLLDLIEEIKAVPKEQIKTCEMPIDVYISEIEGLHTNATVDLSLFTAIGMLPELVDKMLAYSGALRTAQSNWKHLTTDKQKAKDVWKAEAPAMYELRTDLIDHMTFAFRKDESLLQKLNAIKKGNSHADNIQDLASLSVLGKDNLAPLEAINYDVTKCDKAAEEADRMAGILGEVNGRMYMDDESKIIRDKAFTLLKEVVDEVHEYGRFVFRNDPEHRKAYSSKYTRDRNNKYRRSQENISNE